MSKEIFEEKIWGMFRYKFKTPLDSPQVDRIRWHLFPEIRITHAQPDLFQQDVSDETGLPDKSIPEIVRILDIQQEILARSLGEGHRVIHGVAGSGKTLILLYRCLHLAQILTTPILVLCFNITLAARLKNQIAERGLGDRIQILHFHGWCKEQIEKYKLLLPKSDKKPWEVHVDVVIQAAEDGRIPIGQYGAILVDEGHDFDSAWLSLVTKMVDPETNSLLFLYDDAQSIYKKRGALSFSLASVGIQAQGRTSILKLNYRNTKEILNFSYNFSKQHFDSHDDKHMAFMQPEAAGIKGTPPDLKPFNTMSEEVSHLIKWIKKENALGISWSDIAVLCPSNGVGKYLEKAFSKTEIPYNFLFTSEDKKKYNPSDEKISVLPLPSSKGLEFHSVAVIDSSHIIQTDNNIDEDISDEVRRLYVGFTRAKKNLLVTWHTKNSLSESLEKIDSLR
ncbi:DEAD/DEAH box helicase [Rahnella sp. PCH160]|uniref:DEAD/DEAH box helicase n=1 Tax=Rahnella sp. PCH160 TaxID=3447928 RepID=UPI0039FD5B7E